MASVKYFLRTPYKEGDSIQAKVKEARKKGKPAPVTCLSDLETEIRLTLTIPKNRTKADKAVLLRVNTGHKIYPEAWDFKHGLPNNKNTGKAANNHWLKGVLEELKGQVSVAYHDLIRTSSDVSIDTIRKHIERIVKREESVINTHEFYTVFAQFLRDGKFSTRTVQKYNTLKKKLEGFEKSFRYKVNFDTINSEFDGKFNKYLVGELSMKNNTVQKYYADLKTFLRWASIEGFHNSRYFERLSVTRDEVDQVSLEIEEFEKLLQHQPETERLQKTKDIFVFQCLTAQRVSDILSISWADIDNGVWRLFQKKGRKSKVTEIPLHDEAIKIITKYKNHFKPLPVELTKKENIEVSKQKYNDAIKVLCRDAGIDGKYKEVRYSGHNIQEVEGPKYQFISSHTGRHTFVNIAPLFDIPLEVAASITGHKSFKVLQESYRRVKMRERTKAINDMKFNTEPKLKVS